MCRAIFSEPHDRPVIAASVVLPRLELGAEMPFLIDTGASATCITAIEAAQADIIPTQLPDETTVRLEESTGVGGTSETYVIEEEALFAFEDEDQDEVQDEDSGQDKYSLHIEFEHELRISTGAPLNLLGRDIINRFQMEYNFPESEIVLTRDDFATGRYMCIGADEELSPSLRDFDS